MISCSKKSPPIPELARRLSTYQAAELAGTVMLRAELTRPAIEESENLSVEVAVTARSTRRLSLTVMASEKECVYKLAVTLLLGGDIKSESNASCDAGINCAAKNFTVWRQFAAAEVAEYLAVSGDTNSIHRGENAVVPGLLIMAELLREDIIDCAQSRRIAMKFIAPLRIGEAVYYLQEPFGLRLFTADKTIVKITVN